MGGGGDLAPSTSPPHHARAAVDLLPSYLVDGRSVDVPMTATESPMAHGQRMALGSGGAMI
ncbi:hypothetical protein ACHAXA_002605 [Cyclostephanos tholiformis]|uniref:Uncharacterized protein n=1 Tax=Cyclostephanos tholiformis TaxID=382380 RepID=A0ABD3SBF8_9STRA